MVADSELGRFASGPRCGQPYGPFGFRPSVQVSDTASSNPVPDSSAWALA